MSDRVTDYDAVAGGYDRRYATFDFGEIDAALQQFLGDATLGAILELGCGTGHWLRRIAGRARHVAGLDPSARMIAQARAEGVWLVRARAEQLPWPDAAFDRIVCINALHHFADRQRAFEEARRVLRPGGGFFNIGLDPHAERDAWWVYDYFPETREIDLARYPAVRTIRGELVKAGFTWAESFEAQAFESVMPASAAFAAGLIDPQFSSQLAVLTPEEFDRGVSRIREGGADLLLASELHLFATTGWLT